MSANPNESLSPGEIRFSICQKHSGVSPPASDDGAGGCASALFILLILVGLAIFASPSRPVVHTIRVPTQPIPLGSYAIFSSVQGSDTGGQVNSFAPVVAVGFVYERIQIILVPPNDLPAEDTRVAVDTRTARPDAVLRSSQDDSQVYWSMPSRFGADDSGTPRPYILHGDITITCGPMSDEDKGLTAFLLQDGSLIRAAIQISNSNPRGPPVPERKVYVVGTIQNVYGPEQFKHSVVSSKILDLGPHNQSASDYFVAVQHWEQQVEQLEKTFKVGPGELLPYAGEMVSITENGPISKADPSDFSPIANRDGTYERNSSTAPSGTPTPDDHPTEFPL